MYFSKKAFQKTAFWSPLSTQRKVVGSLVISAPESTIVMALEPCAVKGKP